MSDSQIRAHWDQIIRQLLDGPEATTGQVSMLSQEMADKLEWHLTKALGLCPVGSRISLNLDPDVLISCRKEDGTSNLVVKWLIS